MNVVYIFVEKVSKIHSHMYDQPKEDHKEYLYTKVIVSYRDTA